MMTPTRQLAAWVAALAMTALSWTPACAEPVPVVTDARIAEISRALSEQRLVDAGRLLDQSMLEGARDTRLDLLTAELQLVRGRPADALESFTRAQAGPETRAAALQGAGLALSLLGRGDEALAMLNAAVAADPGAGRAWNALGAEHDRRRAWAQSQVAYDRAFAELEDDAPVFNNRGFSRLLQGEVDEAVADFVQALERKPDLYAARTNLRLAMAMRGEYDQSISGGTSEEMPALLNNAGFAAVVRGDYRQADDLLGQAVRARGEYYQRASANLEYARDLAARDGQAVDADR